MLCICLAPAAQWALITLTNSSVLAVRSRPCGHAWGWGLIGPWDTTHSSSEANTSALLTTYSKQTRTHTDINVSLSNSHPFNCTQRATLKWGNEKSNISNNVQHLHTGFQRRQKVTFIFCIWIYTQAVKGQHKMCKLTKHFFFFLAAQYKGGNLDENIIKLREKQTNK